MIMITMITARDRGRVPLWDLECAKAKCLVHLYICYICIAVAL